MVEHMVIFKFNEAAKKEQKDQAIEKLHNLKHVISGIKDLQCNYNFSTRNQGYEIGLTVRFENKSALDEYTPHPKHQEAVSYLKEIGMVDSLVVDFEI